RIAGRVLRRAQHFQERLFEEVPVTHDLEVVYHYTFLRKAGADCRHGARCNPSDVGVMTAGGNVERGNALPIVVEDGHDYGDIWKRGAAVEGIVEHECVARSHGGSAGAHNAAHALSHGT